MKRKPVKRKVAERPKTKSDCNLWGTGRKVDCMGEIVHEVVARVEYQGQWVRRKKKGPFGQKWELKEVKAARKPKP